MKLNQLLIAFMAAGLTQCGSDSPSRPTTVTALLVPPPTGFTAGTTVIVVSAESGRPVARSAVTVAGVSYETNEAGEFTFRQPADFGSFVDIVADDFIERQTLSHRDVVRLELWPATSATGLDRRYTRSLVYENASVNAAEGELEPLTRPGFVNPRVVVVPSEEIQKDPGAMESIRRAVGEMNQVLEGKIAYSVGEDATAVTVTLVVDPSDETIRERNSRAVIRCRRTRFTITSCRVAYRSIEIVQTDTTLHELGHSFGLNHSPDPTEVMGSNSSRRDHTWRFSARERLTIRLALKRDPGNVFPDNDRAAPVPLALMAESVIACIES